MTKKVSPSIQKERQRIIDALNRYFDLCALYKQQPHSQVIEDIIYDTVANKVVELNKEALKNAKIVPKG